MQQACIPSKQHLAGGSTASSSLKKDTEAIHSVHAISACLEHTWAYAYLGGFKMSPVPQR